MRSKGYNPPPVEHVVRPRPTVTPPSKLVCCACHLPKNFDQLQEIDKGIFYVYKTDK